MTGKPARTPTESAGEKNADAIRLFPPSDGDDDDDDNDDHT